MGATGSCKKIEMKLKWFEMDLYEIGTKVGFFSDLEKLKQI